ncbi:MAG: S-layer homology domain-containing protein [Solibacillus sp.]
MKKSTKQKFFTYSSALLVASTTVAFVAEVPVFAQTNPFTDVKETNSHYTAITTLYKDGIVTGVTSSTYKPGQAATRGEAALFLATALGLNMTAVKNPGFKDVPQSSKYYGAVAALHASGVVGGYGDTFKPDNTLTRAQLAKMLTLGFTLEKATNTNTKFTDVNKLTDVPTKQYIQTLIDYKITNGTTATTFSPNEKLTRAQLATFLYNAIGATEDEFEIISIQ